MCDNSPTFNHISSLKPGIRLAVFQLSLCVFHTTAKGRILSPLANSSTSPQILELQLFLQPVHIEKKKVFQKWIWDNAVESCDRGCSRLQITCLSTYQNYSDTRPCLMTKLNRTTTVLKCSPGLTPVRDSAENLLSTSHHLPGTSLGQNLPTAMLLAGITFSKAISRWIKAGRRGKKKNSNYFSLFWSLLQIPSASCPYYWSPPFFIVLWLGRWLLFLRLK